jgi:hypothetical protein
VWGCEGGCVCEECGVDEREGWGMDSAEMTTGPAAAPAMPQEHNQRRGREREGEKRRGNEKRERKARREREKERRRKER